MKSILSILFLSIFSSVQLASQDDAIKEAIKPVREKFALDRRVAVFDINWEQHTSGLVVKGEVDNPTAKSEAIAAIRTVAKSQVLDSIRVLPDPALGEKTFGIVTLSAGNVRSKPGEAEELATQVVMGMVVKLLKKGNGYYYVQSHDKYLGWLDDDAFFITDRQGLDAWAAARKVILTTQFGIVREQPDASSLPVCDVVATDILKSSGTRGYWTHIELADGRTGFIESSLVEDYDTWKRTRVLNGENVEKVAKMLMGVPYLWGGTSAKGMDCSGFTKTVFRLNGLELNRDANQQATMGEDILPGENFQNLKKGDLLFFGRKGTVERPERISHVAIYLENRSYIHSSGRVRYGSFDPTSPYYNEANLKRFVRARRIIATSSIPEVKQ